VQLFSGGPAADAVATVPRDAHRPLEIAVCPSQRLPWSGGLRSEVLLTVASQPRRGRASATSPWLVALPLRLDGLDLRRRQQMRLYQARRGSALPARSRAARRGRCRRLWEFDEARWPCRPDRTQGDRLLLLIGRPGPPRAAPISAARRHVLWDSAARRPAGVTDGKSHALAVPRSPHRAGSIISFVLVAQDSLEAMSDTWRR